MKQAMMMFFMMTCPPASRHCERRAARKCSGFHRRVRWGGHREKSCPLRRNHSGVSVGPSGLMRFPLADVAGFGRCVPATVVVGALFTGGGGAVLGIAGVEVAMSGALVATVGIEDGCGAGGPRSFGTTTAATATATTEPAANAKRIDERGVPFFRGT